MLETTKVQLAALNAGIVFWSGWVQNAAQFAQKASGTIMSIETGSIKVEEIAMELTDSSREFLRKTVELPQSAMSTFQKELEKIKPASGRAKRAAKAKD